MVEISINKPVFRPPALIFHAVSPPRPGRLDPCAAPGAALNRTVRCERFLPSGSIQSSHQSNPFRLLCNAPPRQCSGDPMALPPPRFPRSLYALLDPRSVTLCVTDVVTLAGTGQFARGPPLMSKSTSTRRQEVVGGDAATSSSHFQTAPSAGLANTCLTPVGSRNK